MNAVIKISLALVLLPGAAFAQTRAPTPAQRYQACLNMVQQDAAQAFESALAWRDAGGGFPARHCAALALLNLNRPREAADRLQQLGDEMGRAGEPAPLVAAVLAQAGQAWFAAEELGRADAALHAATEMDPEKPDYWIERARVVAQTQARHESLGLLNRALRLDPAHAEAYAMRASAKRFQNDLAGAMEDVELAIAIDPDLASAYLERGNLHAAMGRRDAARADWLKVRLLRPQGPLFDAAGRNLERLDVR